MKPTFLIAGAALMMTAVPALADIVVKDPYARAANTMAGAAFMMIENTGDAADRLIDARADVSKRVELHTHKDMGDGIMKMVHVEEGFAIPAGETHALARGGDHVMFMGLNAPFVQGESFALTLVFENAGEIVVDVPVDLERKPMHGGGMKHGAMNGAMKPSN
ncbi:copper chaperone PCu(A)C [Tropicibacter naphthalenivorans]|uniref:Copper-binding protein n=1 Tax=Tropicibacter naphthalenivorans TaxID=441103 RepID=A0A0P1G940_9RHOB|nr:copper chaperone PCu(A)C [Tropicibacter naphthalenivorans]CUH78106.1 hypothetical protein TRN7648_01797 [Tropicibacter naphthalenivorans]SMC93542.1 hypothetical protein SAMN04488093_10744 [Tropicibacter naphthalenivorans]